VIKLVTIEYTYLIVHIKKFIQSIKGMHMQRILQRFLKAFNITCQVVIYLNTRIRRDLVKRQMSRHLEKIKSYF
jgi:hypothetical protein